MDNVELNKDAEEQMVNHVLRILSMNRGILDFVDKRVDEMKVSEYRALVKVCKSLTGYQEPKKQVMRGGAVFDGSETTKYLIKITLRRYLAKAGYFCLWNLNGYLCSKRLITLSKP